MTSINADLTMHNPLMARARARRAVALASGGLLCALAVAVVGSVAVSAQTGSGAAATRTSAQEAIAAQPSAANAPMRKVRIIQIYAVSEDQKAMARR